MRESPVWRARESIQASHRFGGIFETEAQRGVRFGGTNETEAQREGRFGGTNETQEQRDARREGGFQRTGTIRILVSLVGTRESFLLVIRPSRSANGQTRAQLPEAARTAYQTRHGESCGREVSWTGGVGALPRTVTYGRWHI